MKDEYKCASTDTGDECVVMDGILQRLWLCVGSCLDRTFVSSHIVTICHIPCSSIIFAILVFVHTCSGCSTL